MLQYSQNKPNENQSSEKHEGGIKGFKFVKSDSLIQLTAVEGSIHVNPVHTFNCILDSIMGMPAVITVQRRKSTQKPDTAVWWSTIEQQGSFLV